jgi:hypothetical protein
LFFIILSLSGNYHYLVNDDLVVILSSCNNEDKLAEVKMSAMLWSLFELANVRRFPKKTALCYSCDWK